MGLAPEKASRIKARDTQTTWPDPWSITLEVNPGSGMMDLGSVHKLAGDETSGADPWSMWFE